MYWHTDPDTFVPSNYIWRYHINNSSNTLVKIEFTETQRRVCFQAAGLEKDDFVITQMEGGIRVALSEEREISTPFDTFTGDYLILEQEGYEEEPSEITLDKGILTLTFEIKPVEEPKTFEIK